MMQAIASQINIMPTNGPQTFNLQIDAHPVYTVTKCLHYRGSDTNTPFSCRSVAQTRSENIRMDDLQVKLQFLNPY